MADLAVAFVLHWIYYQVHSRMSKLHPNTPLHMKQNQAIFLKFYTLIQHDHASITLKPVYTLLSHS